jgi:hypothetical protein
MFSVSESPVTNRTAPRHPASNRASVKQWVTLFDETSWKLEYIGVAIPVATHEPQRNF